MSNASGGQLALVMSGGGARAAYQVGMLRWLARRHPDLHVPILTGVSAGAINAAFLASHPDDFRTRVQELADLWSHLTAEEVFRVDSLSLAHNVLRLGLKLASGGAMVAPRTHAAVDTKPLWRLLERALEGQGDGLPGIEANLRRGALKAVAITTSSYTTGQSITWVQGCGIPQWERAHRRSIDTKLGVRHVMASAALPIFFPAIEIDGHWFGDGGIRLTAPLSPAVHLGADRILATSSVGSLKVPIRPGTFVVPHDYVAFWNIPTFFDEEVRHVTPSMDEGLRKVLLAAAWTAKARAAAKGVYVQATGPRLETKAEIACFKTLGDIVGMPVASEATLAAELGIPYAALCSVDNYCHGLTPKPLTFPEIRAMQKRTWSASEAVLAAALEAL